MMPLRSARRLLPDLFSVLFLVAMNAFVLNFLSFRYLNFSDGGARIDLAWRIAQGQIPGRDIILSIGPVHFDLMAVFFVAFGFGKFAILAHMVVINALVIGWVYWASRKHLPVPLAFWPAALACTSFYWAACFPNYNQTAHLFGLIGACYLVACLPFESARKAWTGGFLCGAGCFLAFMTKTTIGPAYAVAFAIPILMDRRRGAAIMGGLAGFLAAVIFVRLFLISSYADFFEQIAAYTFVRAQSPSELAGLLSARQWLVNYYWVPAGAVICAGAFFYKSVGREFGQRVVFFFLLWFVGTFTMFTTGATYQTEVEPLPLYLGLGLILIYGLRPSNLFEGRVRKILLSGLVVAAVFLTALHAYYGLTLYANQNPECRVLIMREKPGDYAIQAAPFKGWKCGRVRGEPLDAMVRFINENIPKDDEILILTNMHILNGLTGRPGYKGIPWYFSPGFLPAPGTTVYDQVRKTILTHPPSWIVTNTPGFNLAVGTEKMVIQQLDLERVLPKHYALVKTFGDYLLLRRISIGPTLTE